MKLILQLLTLVASFPFKLSSAEDESGICPDLENIPERNFLYDKTLEVDPCGPQIFKKCLQTNSTGIRGVCSVKLMDPTTNNFKVIVNDYNYTANFVKLAMMIPVSLEYFIEARASTGDGTFDPSSEKIGHFEDLVFKKCNSFACCDTSSEITNVARKCTDADIAPTKSVYNKNIYTMAYSWHPPSGYAGLVLFVAAFSQSNNEHWVNIVSRSVLVSNLLTTTTTPSTTTPLQSSPHPLTTTMTPSTTTPSHTSPHPLTTTMTPSTTTPLHTLPHPLTTTRTSFKSLQTTTKTTKRPTRKATTTTTTKRPLTKKTTITTRPPKTQPKTTKKTTKTPQKTTKTPKKTTKTPQKEITDRPSLPNHPKTVQLQKLPTSKTVQLPPKNQPHSGPFLLPAPKISYPEETSKSKKSSWEAYSEEFQENEKIKRPSSNELNNYSQKNKIKPIIPPPSNWRMNNNFASNNGFAMAYAIPSIYSYNFRNCTSSTNCK